MIFKMMVIYHCYGGTHASPVAAAIHLGILGEKIPPVRQLIQLPFYDKVVPRDYGRLFYVGDDQQGHQVYVMGVQNSREVMKRAILGIWGLLGGDQQQIFLVDVFPCVNWMMRLGGFLSRQLGLVSLGRPLVCWGTQRAYPLLLAVVKKAQRELVSRG